MSRCLLLTRAADNESGRSERSCRLIENESSDPNDEVSFSFQSFTESSYRTDQVFRIAESATAHFLRQKGFMQLRISRISVQI